MSKKRYTHFSTFCHNKLYVFGGRTYGDDIVAIINDVEAYNVMSNTWETLAGMTKRRCLGHSLIFDDEIYVFGGYTGKC